MASLQNCVDWLRLGRVSALPTSLSNIMLGYLLGTRLHGAEFRLEALVLGLASSSCLYTAGMILNDVFDVKRDSIERPERPLPAGKISILVARNVGMGLLLLGIFFASAGIWWLKPANSFELLRPVWISIALAISILAYDYWLKQTALAPWLMGLCRALNLLLGASFALPEIDIPWGPLGFASPILALAFSLGIYVSGITYLGRNEAVANSSRWTIWIGTGLILTGVWGLSLTNHVFPFSDPRDRQLATMFPWLMLLLTLPVLRRSLTAGMTGSPRRVQAAVISSLRSIIVFDAALCFLAAPELPGYALVVLSFLLPSQILSRWLKPT